MPHLTRSESTQTYYSGNLTVLVRAGTTLPLPNAGVLILPSSAVYFPARRGTRCICPHWLIRRKHYKLLRKKKNHSCRAHGLRAAGTAFVIAVSWSCCALSSLHSVVLQWNTRVCKHCLEQHSPLLHKERDFLSASFFLPLPATSQMGS